MSFAGFGRVFAHINKLGLGLWMMGIFSETHGD